MKSFKKLTHEFLILFIFLSTTLLAQDKESKTFLFGLIKLDRDSEFEDGYWINKWFYSREFAAPVNLIPIEFRYGIGVSGKTTGSASNLDNESFKDDPKKISYDSDATPISQGIRNIWGPSIEIDVGLINIPHYIVGTSWLNVMSGISYRNSTLYVPAKVPYEDWSTINSTWGDTAYFSPRLNEYFLTTHLQYQPFHNWYLNFRYSYGLSWARFYSLEADTWESSPSGSGTSAAGAVGIRFIIDPGKRNRFTAGLDFRYSYTKIHTIKDPLELTPINRFDLSNYGLYFTLSAFYGGNKTSGDKAKGHYFRKNYIEALKTFRTFVAEYPAHSNVHRAKKYIQDCEFKIPYVLMEQGLVLERKGKTQKALNKYQYALTKVRNDPIVDEMLSGRINQIALLWMIEAEKLLKEEKYVRAYSLVKIVSEFSNEGKKEIKRFKSWVVLGEGKQYQELGFIGRAMQKYTEALELNPDLIYEVKSLQYKAGIQMAKLATEANEFEEIQLAIYALEYARELAGGIGEKNEKLLIDLYKKLESYDNYKLREIIDYKMNLGRLDILSTRSKNLAIGQTLPEVESLLGPPHEKILGESGQSAAEQLWIYFTKAGSLYLTFDKYQLFKIEKL